MQFNQTNKNQGDVNNAISERGNVVQSTGDSNKIQLDQPKASIWSALWKKATAAWGHFTG
jgi:hypothetical protein